VLHHYLVLSLRKHRLENAAVKTRDNTLIWSN
jgi:hypothetical protein